MQCFLICGYKRRIHKHKHLRTCRAATRHSRPQLSTCLVQIYLHAPQRQICAAKALDLYRQATRHILFVV